MTFLDQVPLMLRFGALATSVAVVGACTASTRSEVDPRLCQQTYEFGNSGCADITGQVLGPAGQPLSGMSVGPSYIPGREEFNSPFRDTDVDGRFRIRLHRFGAPPPAGNPDTVSLYIRATDPRSAGLNIPARVRDSVRIQVTVAPVGSPASITEVVLRLPPP